MDVLVALGVAVLLTRVGFALYAAGLVRAKNSAAMVMRVIADLCIAVLAFWAIGAAILLHFSNIWFGVNTDLLFGRHVDPSAASYLFFYFAMILTVASVVGGAVAERCRFFPLCISTLVLTGFVCPAAAKLSWWGWLTSHGFVDLAGASALQVSAGVFAAVAIVFIGPRMGKFNRDRSSSMIPGHNLPMAAIGAIVMAIGWIAYIAGACMLRQPSTGSVAALNVLLATAAGGFASIATSQIRYGKPDILLTLTGLLGGAVSLCAAGFAIPQWAAVVIGAVAGVIVPLTVVVIDLRLRLDDPLGVVAIHAVGGAWGTLAAGFFIRAPVAPLNRAQQIGIQAVGVVVIALFAAAVATLLFMILKATMELRTKEADEFDGLDLAEHDIGAYPDFQQNSIKSYHLREA